MNVRCWRSDELCSRAHYSVLSARAADDSVPFGCRLGIFEQGVVLFCRLRPRVETPEFLHGGFGGRYVVQVKLQFEHSSIKSSPPSPRRDHSG